MILLTNFLQSFVVHLSGAMPIAQLENDLAAYTLRPNQAVTGGVSVHEFLERFHGNFGISDNGQVRISLF